MNTFKNSALTSSNERANNVKKVNSLSCKTSTELRKGKVAKKLQQWLEIDFSIKIFGYTIIKFHFPPQDEQSEIKEMLDNLNFF